MNKPISMILMESKQNIINAVNDTKLQPVLLEPIMREIYDEVHRQSIIQCENERIAYENALNQEPANE